MASQAPANPGERSIGPSEDLEAIMGNLSEAIRDRLRRTLDTFLQYYRDNAETETVALASNCCSEAQIWFWAMLESYVSDEKERRGRDVSALLQNGLFHCCLVACSLDVAIVSTSFPCDVPLLLQIISLAPYHFLKVTEPLLRSKVDVSKHVFQHFCQTEKQIVEVLAWASDSPLWEEVKANGGCLPPCKQVMMSPQLEEPNAVLVDDPRPLRRTALDMFARKVYRLMDKRLQEQCSRLQVSDEIRQKIWTCFDHSLSHFTDLMVDRHLDQLMLCAISIVTEVCKIVPISSEVAENQRHEHQILTPNTPSSHRPGEESRRDLTDFYKQVYVPKLEPFVKQFQPLAKVETPPLSPYPEQSRPAFLRQRLSNSVYVSPLNKDTPNPRSPVVSNTFTLRCSECLKDMNKKLKQHLQTKEASGDEPPVKRPRLGNESIHQQQLRDLMNDRMAAKAQDCSLS